MKITVFDDMEPVEKEVDAIECTLPVRYPEDIPSDFPGRVGSVVKLTLDLNTGKVRDWPAAQEGSCFLKVADEGKYRLLAGDEEVACINENYVPGCIPRQFGDYVDLDIATDGTLSGWTPNAEKVIAAFFGSYDD